MTLKCERAIIREAEDGGSTGDKKKSELMVILLLSSDHVMLNNEIRFYNSQKI